jgi:5-methylcytosine-specific restriction endonuclease McrBC GTP-binding regulatory subunit McrB
VRADWTDNRSMLGYYNPLTERYVPTELLRLLLHALAHPDTPHFAILDEMNLAKVEYYFSDFLSAMESGTEIALHDAGEAVTAEIQGEELPIPERIRVPANLLFTGTVNVDETTFMFSSKVLDRANVLQFHTVDLERYGAAGDIAASPDGFVLTAKVDLDELLRTAPARRDDYVRLSAASRTCLVTTNAILAQYHLHFGYRVANEIARYLGLVEKHLGADAVPRALDLQIQQKILPKFVGNRAKLERPLWELLLYLQTGTRDGLALTATALDGLEPQASKFPGSVAALQHMLQTLRQVGFASFIE